MKTLLPAYLPESNGYNNIYEVFLIKTSHSQHMEGKLHIKDSEKGQYQRAMLFVKKGCKCCIKRCSVHVTDLFWYKGGWLHL